MADEQDARWPRRLIVRAGRIAYPAAERIAPKWLIQRMRRIKERIIFTPAWRVLAILELLAAAEVRVWVAGGWGIDALLGRQSRPHCDIDLVIGDDGPPYEQVAHILAGEGFRFDGAFHTPGIAIPWCHVWRHDAGHKVEILPVALHEPPFAAAGMAEAGSWQPFTEGMIDGQPVPCLSAQLQVLLHTGYPRREIDNCDIALLRENFDLPEWRMTA